MEEHNPFAKRSGGGTVYGLKVKNGPIRYVGATCRDVKARVMGSHGPLVDAWKKSVGTRMRYVILESVPEGENLREAEYQWYVRLKSEGRRLLNTQTPHRWSRAQGHGSATCYDNYRCRRPECVRAHALRQRNYYREKRGLPLVDGSDYKPRPSMMRS